MSSHLTPSRLDEDVAQAAADARYYRATLHGIIDMANDMARAIHGQAMAQGQASPIPPEAARGAWPSPAPGVAVDLAVSFDRIARVVRRTVLLAQRVAMPPRPIPNRDAARRQIIRAVEDSIDRTAAHASPPLDAGSLHAELRERLDAPELAETLDGDIATRPLPDIIAEIRRDLGLEPLPGAIPARRRTPADLASLQARAAARPTPSPAPIVHDG